MNTMQCPQSSIAENQHFNTYNPQDVIFTCIDVTGKEYICYGDTETTENELQEQLLCAVNFNVNEAGSDGIDGETSEFSFPNNDVFKLLF